MGRRVHPAPDIEIVLSSEPEEVFREISAGSCVITSTKVHGAAGYVEKEEDFEELTDDYLIKTYDRFVGRPHIVDEFDTKCGRAVLKELCADDYEGFMKIMIDGGETICSPRERAQARSDFEEFKNASAPELKVMSRIFGDSLKMQFLTTDMGIWGLFIGDLLVGFCSITVCPNDLEMGYGVLKEYRKQGLAYLMSSRILRYARDEIGVLSVNLGTDPDNEASRALARKLGFSLIEEKKDELLFSMDF